MFKNCRLARMSDGHYCLLRSLGPVKGGNGMKRHEVVIDFSRRGMVELFRAMPLVPVDAIKAAWRELQFYWFFCFFSKSSG
jgi:hypothetical protein